MTAAVVLPCVSPAPPVDILCEMTSDHLKCLSSQATYDDIKRVVKAAADGPLKGILAYTEDQVSNFYSLGLWLLVLASIFLMRAAFLGSSFGHFWFRLWVQFSLCSRLSPVTSMVTAIPPPLMRVLALH